jgi:sialate O-acetylesterase
LLLALTFIGLVSLDVPLSAQVGTAPTRPLAQAPTATPAGDVLEPVAWRVYQRDANGTADIPHIPDGFTHVGRGGGIALATGRGYYKQEERKLVGLPIGGPYTIHCRVKKGNTSVDVAIGPIFVGDLWVLAGQSNMQGVGDLIDTTPPHPKVMLLGMDGKWGQAEEPLHWLADSPDPVHSGDPKTRAERSLREHKSRKKGAGLGLPFAVAMVEATGVPIGLVASAHGGTSMAQWSPALKEQGGASLYGSMLRQVKLAGGKVKGVLWYQGESDAMGRETWKAFPKVFSEFISAVRSDLGQSDLPFYYVQIGRFANPSDPTGWNAVQDAQRVLPERIANLAVISVIDLELDDAIHVGTQGLQRAGRRLAHIAQRELFGQVGATTPTFDRVTKGPGNTLVVKFKGVNMGPGRPAGMAAFGAGGRGGMMGFGASTMSPGEASGFGLKPERHIAGFSLRREDGTLIPAIFEACVGQARDTVILKLDSPVPRSASLWYGHGLDPYCNLTDGLDMGVPVFGPIALDEITSTAVAGSANPSSDSRTIQGEPIKLLIITGDHGHAWKDTTKILEQFLGATGRIKTEVTTTPSLHLTDENLSRYDVLLLNYKDTPDGAPETRWSDSNKEAFLKAVRDGKGLVVFHHASSAFIKPNWTEFEKAIAGGWRAQGYHGPKHVFTVKKSDVKHPISEGLPIEFVHKIDELYQNSKMVPGSVVLATAYSDPNKPRGTGMEEPVIWVNSYGKGRVYENVLGHDAEAMSDQSFQEWMRRGVIWAATGKAD